ncbi:hypothetical protein WG78_00060 [Amantichitinum ursilacus]|uniref:Uncharacterized protein n=1 Tax=Amantichitinum ursilacus TaxID=857265 RepID=A0A0N0XMQ5_9NEIS|nr:hypothetical protein WG78_00060 [Amantichitinum ursilacus]
MVGLVPPYDHAFFELHRVGHDPPIKADKQNAYGCLLIRVFEWWD